MKAAARVICIFVDCDWGAKNTDLSGKYGVRGYPTCVFTDSEGKELAKLAKRDAASVLAQINEIADKHTKGPAYVASLEEAVAKAKEDRKPILYLFTTAKDDSKKLEEAFADDSLKDVLEKFVMARREIKKDDADAKLFRVATSTQPVVFIVDAEAEKPEEKPLKKWTGKKTVKDLKKDLEAFLKSLEEKK